MSRAEEYWIYQQLEPNDILVSGSKQKREPRPDFDKEYIAKHGLAAWQDKMAEYRQWEQDRYKD